MVRGATLAAGRRKVGLNDRGWGYGDEARKNYLHEQSSYRLPCLRLSDLYTSAPRVFWTISGDAVFPHSTKEETGRFRDFLKRPQVIYY